MDLGRRRAALPVVPAKAGTQVSAARAIDAWIPAFAGKTRNKAPVRPPLTRRGALDADLQHIERLAGAHEDAVALGAAEGEVGAYLGKADATQ